MALQLTLIRPGSRRTAAGSVTREPGPSALRRPPVRLHARAAGRFAALLVVATSCFMPDVPDSDQTTRGAAAQSGGAQSVSQVRVALGWRAREVERRSTPGIQRFDDLDEGVIILEHDPSALAYADPAHAFVLPPGRYLRLDQAAGRVYAAAASPQLDVVGPAAAVALADSVARLLEGASWARVPGGGLGSRAAVAEAVRLIPSAGTGTVDVGTWRIPRSPEPWAAVPPDPKPYRRDREGVDATLMVRPIKGRSQAEGEPRLLLTLQLEDDRLSSALIAMVLARRARGGDDTLAGWDRAPAERLVLGGPR